MEFGFCGFSEVDGVDDVFGVKAFGVGDALLLIDAGENDAVGEAQAGDEFGLEDLATEGVGAGLEDCP